MDQQVAPIEQADGVLDAPVEQHDPLLAALEYLAKHHGRSFSAAAVLSGLPLRGGKLTLDLFARAAERLGFEARVVKRKPSLVSGLVCPFVFLLKSGDAGILLERRQRARKVPVVIPGQSDVKTMRLRDIDREALDIVIYVTDKRQQDAVGSNAAMMRQLKGHWLWSVVWRFWPTWLHLILAALLINVLALALPLFTMNVYDRVIPYNSLPTLWALASGVVIAFGFDFMLRMLRAIVIENSGRRIDMRVSAVLFEQALDASMASRSARAGEFANHIREFEAVRDFFTSSSVTSAIDLLFIGLFLALLWVLVGPLAVVPLVAVPVVLIATLLIQIPLARSVAAAQLTKTNRHSILVESMVGIETLKAVGGEGAFQKRWEDAVAGSVRASSATRFWSSLAMYFSIFVQQAVSVIIIIAGVYMVSAGEITIGALIAANMLASRVLAPLSGIAMTLARAQASFSALRQLNAMMRLDRDHRTPPPGGGGPIAAGGLEFRTLEFAYPNQPAKALDGISLTIKPGERVGIVGRVASGKSTLGKVVSGLYEPAKGGVIADGTDIRHRWMADVRQAIAYVGQDPELFSGTLRDNILLGRTCDDQTFEACARAAGVALFAQAHPQGYGLMVGERGRAISGGQRQSVAVARALIGNPKALFLDEPTSAMDNLTEAVFIRSFRDWLKPETTLLVATHRTSLLELVDRLIVLDAGKVIADGPKAKVLEWLLSGRRLAAPGEGDA